jgi:hypothetical protein
LRRQNVRLIAKQRPLAGSQQATVMKSFLAGRAAIVSPAAFVAVVVAIVSTAEAVRVANAATAAAPQIVGRGVGAAWDSLVGQGGSGQCRYRDGGKECISQKYSHLKSP